jgi:hypothetical protein
MWADIAPDFEDFAIPWYGQGELRIFRHFPFVRFAMHERLVKIEYKSWAVFGRTELRTE